LCTPYNKYLVHHLANTLRQRAQLLFRQENTPCTIFYTQEDTLYKFLWNEYSIFL